MPLDSQCPNCGKQMTRISVSMVYRCLHCDPLPCPRCGPNVVCDHLGWVYDVDKRIKEVRQNMRNPNGPSIEEKEAMQDQLDDMNQAWLSGKASVVHKLTGLVNKWEEALAAFTSPYYTIEKPMEATKVLEQCIMELKTAIG